MPHLAARTHAGAFGQLLGLAAVEIQKAHHQLARVVGNGHDQLSTRSVLDFAGCDDAFHLRRIARHETGFADWHDLRFILVAQGQMQHQIHVRAQAKPGELVLDLVRAR